MGKQKKNRQGAEKTFQKKKVKVGKKLPKSTNVTNTSFKTKTIQIIQQLKRDEEEATTKRRVNIKELLSQCQHYNVTVRLGAAKGLKELLLISNETVTAYLGLVVDRAGSLMTDKDCSVREAVLKLFQELFEKVPSNCMSPFFPVLCAHLCCAMTHINGEIQQDSLSMFDLLLDTYPQLVVSGSNQLMSNFVEQISKQKFRNVKSDALNSKDLKFTLAVTPNSRLTSQKWQAKVLTRLYKLLSIVLKPVDTNTDSKSSSEYILTCGSRASVPFENHVKDQWTASGFIIKSNSNTTSKISILDDITSIKQLVVSLFPLLLQCWVEAHDPEKTEGSLLYPEAIAVRTTVLKIVLLLIRHGAQNSDRLDVPWQQWLTEQYSASFENYFITCFPYELLQTKKSVKKQRQAQSDVSPEALNLSVISVMIKFVKCPTEFLLQQPWVQTILKYTRDAIMSDDLSLPTRKQLLEVLNDLIYAVRSDDREALLNDSLLRYEKSHALSQEKQMFITFFSSVIFSEDDRRKLSPSLVKFLESLPVLLMEVGTSNISISARIVSVIKEAVTSNCTQLIKKWQNCIGSVFDIENDVFINSSDFVKKSLIEIFYWLHDIGPNDLRILTELIHSDKLEGDHGLYLIKVLHQRYLNSVKEGEGAFEDKMADHLGFLLLVMCGPVTGKNNNSISAKDTDQEQITPIDWSRMDRCEKQMDLNTHICQILATDFKCHEKLMKEIIWTHFERKILNSQQVDLRTVLSFVKLVEQYGCEGYFTEHTIDLLIDLILDLLAIKNGSFALNVSVELANKMFKHVEKILSTQVSLLEKFVEQTMKRILSKKDLVSLVQMLVHVVQQNCIQIYILENQNTNHQFYKNHFHNLSKFVEENLSEFITESWWSAFKYFLELL